MSVGAVYTEKDKILFRRQWVSGKTCVNDYNTEISNRKRARGLGFCVLACVVVSALAANVQADEGHTGFEASVAPNDWNQPADQRANPRASTGTESRLPKAENIDLEALTPELKLTPEPTPSPASIAEPAVLNAIQPDAVEPAAAKSAPTEPSAAVEQIAKSLILLGTEVPTNMTTRLSWSPTHTFEGIAVPTPVLVVNGANPGPRLCLTAAVHGDELNGIEIVRRVLYRMDPQNLAGTVIGVPIVNLQGFRRGSRYLPDRRDLNRFFPGTDYGSSASRIANSLFNEIIVHCDALVDLHTGSFYRSNLPQLRADLTNPHVEELAHAFSSLVVLHSKPAQGTLRAAATNAGIVTVTLEAGEPMRLQEEEVSAGVEGVWSLLNSMGMYPNDFAGDEPQPVYYQSKWLRVNKGGILFSKVKLGSHVSQGDLLGTVTDPITNARLDIISPISGRVLGMALDQVVVPGFAAYRIGLEPDDGNGQPVEDLNRVDETAHTSQVTPDEQAMTPAIQDAESSE